MPRNVPHGLVRASHGKTLSEGSNSGYRDRYRRNLARHLIGISRDLESRVIRVLEEDGGYRDLRPSFGPFLSLIWDEGRPLTAVASELAISRQACSQLANLMEDAGYLTRKPNPADRRSKVVSLTRRGRSLVESGVRIILEIESEYAGLIGPSAHRHLTRSLGRLFLGLGLPSPGDAASSPQANQSIGVLPLVGVRVQQLLMEATTASGHPGLKMSHGQVLPLIGSDGGRIFEIARIQGVSRQAISTISQDLQSLGYLRREPDPLDRRGVVLELTTRGESLIRDSVDALDGLEAGFVEILGVKALERFKRIACDLYQALHLEEEIFEANAEDKKEQPRVMGSPSRGAEQIAQIASRLRSQLGDGDAARLAALLGA